MIHSQCVQHGCMKVMNAHPIFHGLVADLVGGAIHCPALNPPPASHTLKPDGPWSRPAFLDPAPCEMGRRPNSPPQTTSVLSSNPRCLRSVNSAAAGLSVLAQE